MELIIGLIVKDNYIKKTEKEGIYILWHFIKQEQQVGRV